jgi:hypothetical protein
VEASCNFWDSEAKEGKMSSACSDNIDTTKKNTETLIDATSKEVNLKEKTQIKLSIRCCLVTRMQDKIMT